MWLFSSSKAFIFAQVFFSHRCLICTVLYTARHFGGATFFNAPLQFWCGDRFTSKSKCTHASNPFVSCCKVKVEAHLFPRKTPASLSSKHFPDTFKAILGRLSNLKSPLLYTKGILLYLFQVYSCTQSFGKAFNYAKVYLSVEKLLFLKKETSYRTRSGKSRICENNSISAFGYSSLYLIKGLSGYHTKRGESKGRARRSDLQKQIRPMPEAPNLRHRVDLFVCSSFPNLIHQTTKHNKNKPKKQPSLGLSQTGS